MIDVKLIDGRNITYKIAYEVARVRESSFADNVVEREQIPYELRVDFESLPPMAEYELIESKIRLLKGRIAIGARMTYTTMLSDPRLRAFVLVDTEKQDKIVGISEWSLPEYVDAPFKISLGRKIYVFWLRLWYRVLDYFDKEPPSVNVRRVFRFATTRAGYFSENPQKSIEELQKLSRSELVDTVYPKVLSYYLRFFAVHRGYRGQGLGLKLIQASLDHMRSIAVEPPMLDGPAKAEWMSAPTAQPFYRNLKIRETDNIRTPEGYELNGFFTNLD